MKAKYRKINKLIDAVAFATMMQEKWGKFVSIQQFSNPKWEHGSYLCMIRNKEKKTETYYFLKKIWIAKVNFSYSAHPSIRQGKELLISNMKLPKRVDLSEWNGKKYQKKLSTDGVHK